MQSIANTKLAENCIEQPGVCIYDPSNPDGVCNEDHCKACSMPRKDGNCQCSLFYTSAENFKQRCPYWTIRRK